MIAKELMHIVHHLGRGDPAHGIAHKKLEGNPYWPDDLAGCGRAGARALRAPAAPGPLEDPGRQGPRPLDAVRRQRSRARARPSGRASIRAPGGEVPREWSEGFIRRLLVAAYDEKPEELADLRKAGFRVYTNPAAAPCPSWKEEPLPKWTEPYRWEKGTLRGVRYLLTFCPWKFLPVAVRKAYLAGELNLLPFPGSLVFFGAPPYLELQRQLPLAGQIPLLHSLFRHEAANSIRIPQSGWLHEARPDNGHEPQRLRPGPRHVPPLAPLAADPSPRGRIGRRRHRGQADPRALQHRAGRHQPLQQADGPQRPDLEPRVRAAAGRSAGRRPTISSTWPTGWPPAGCSAIA